MVLVSPLAINACNFGNLAVFSAGTPMHPLRLWFALLASGTASTMACTIFVLTDENRALFCNNEDWFNRATRLWFVPGGKGYLGCAFVGFDNGWAQGGVNEAGLAFDWVAGFEETYVPDPVLKPVRGNPSERMLESCSTIEEAMTFYRTYLEPDFRRSRILIADRTGASVVIGASNGKLHFAPRRDSRGFGWARPQLEKELAKSPEPSLDAGAAILRACVQPGDGGTKYSNVFDLKAGEIVLFPDPRRDERITLHLATELAKGGHYYDIPRIREQLSGPPRPLLNNMKRFFLDEFSPIADAEPHVTERVQRLLQEASAGAMRETDYAPEFWRKVAAPAQKQIQSDLQRLGPIQSLALVARHEEAGLRSYRFIVEFAKARVLGRCVVQADDRVTLLQSDATELKPGIVLGSN